MAGGGGGGAANVSCAECTQTVLIHFDELFWAKNVYTEMLFSRMLILPMRFWSNDFWPNFFWVKFIVFLPFPIKEKLVGLDTPYIIRGGKPK